MIREEDETIITIVVTITVMAIVLLRDFLSKQYHDSRAERIKEALKHNHRSAKAILIRKSKHSVLYEFCTDKGRQRFALPSSPFAEEVATSPAGMEVLYNPENPHQSMAKHPGYTEPLVTLSPYTEVRRYVAMAITYVILLQLLVYLLRISITNP